MSARSCGASCERREPEAPLPSTDPPAAAPATLPAQAAAGVADGASSAALTLGMTILERGWLSANQVVFRSHDDTPPTVVDTGFSGHSVQTLALVYHALSGEPLGRIVNTHLHSDHCGGNRALQERGGVETWVPAASLDAVRHWDEAALTYRLTDQPCPRFAVHRALVPGQCISLGAGDWQIHAAPGHDMDAALFFEPQTRTLIAGDALWEERLAIIFPELAGDDGFGPARATLALIEKLAPREVIPGHGRPFGDVARALASSRQRIEAFEKHPERHADHAARALLMFHLLEVRSAPIDSLVAWMSATPIYRTVAHRAGLEGSRLTAWARSHVRRLIDDGNLLERDGHVAVSPQAQ
jgi:glyoxylase-like metal-dependent hydrolase (beta-lactamase superfamily II)